VPQFLPELLAGGSSPAAASLLLVGDVDFGATGGSRGEEQVVRRSAARGQGPARFQFAELPGTRAELEAVQGFFQRRFPGDHVRVLRREAATEAALRAEAARSRFV